MMFLIPSILMLGLTLLYYRLLPYMLIRYAMVATGILLLSGYYWKMYKSGNFSKMLN